MTTGQVPFWEPVTYGRGRLLSRIPDALLHHSSGPARRHTPYPGAADFSGISAGEPLVFDAAMAAQAAINQQKTLSKVSIARPISFLKMRAHPDTAGFFRLAEFDVCGATKTEKLELISDASLEQNQFVIDVCEYGPEPEKVVKT